MKVLVEFEIESCGKCFFRFSDNEGCFCNHPKAPFGYASVLNQANVFNDYNPEAPDWCPIQVRSSDV